MSTLNKKENHVYQDFVQALKDFTIKLSNRKEGVEFNTPRNSLIFSIKNNTSSGDTIFLSEK